MQLVEVVAGTKTNPDVVNKALSFVRRIDRLPLPVKSSPGFLVNRALMPYLMEAMNLLQEGVPAELIDKAAVKFGMPMGPIELADTVGLDVCLSVADNLTKHFGGEVPERLRQMVKAGELGRKSGKGFYVYKNGKAIKAKAADNAISPDVTDRLILRMVNEAMACLREGVVQDADLLDAGMIFGTGFAPFRGGPMHYAKTRGYADVLARLQQFTNQYGERFKPDAGWQNLQGESKKSPQIDT
jgi:3-hydroxyacyl-CoA dehydrogenase/enoyl-CoA hydratase/3-hydroxybutyryl-CoA epimerase